MSSKSVNAQDYAADNHELDLARLLGELIDHRVCILGVTLFFALCGTMYALLASQMPWYKSKVNRRTAFLKP